MTHVLEREYDNPFCTRRVQPGALPFLFPAGESVEVVMARLQAARGRGAIIGPHGSGKSTLLTTLLPAIEALGRRIIRVDLHDGVRRLPAGTLSSGCDPNTLLVIDGYEQLSRWSRWLVRWRTRGCGLLVTAHAEIGLPPVYRATPAEPAVQQLVRSLLAAAPVGITEQDVSAAYRRHNGNIRETFFALYDLYELRKPLPAHCDFSAKG